VAERCYTGASATAETTLASPYPMQSTLTRAQFDGACKALVEKYSVLNCEAKGLKRWHWNEHPVRLLAAPFLETLAKNCDAVHVWLWIPVSQCSAYKKKKCCRRDEYRRASGSQRRCCLFYSGSISRTRQLFSAHCVFTHVSGSRSLFHRSRLQYAIFSILPLNVDQKRYIDGSPLSLDDLIQTSLFKALVFEGAELTKFALSLRGASFPLLSQGDHPTTGRPSWYLHPCETSSAVGEVMREFGEADWSEEAALTRWIEVWIMIVGTAIDWVE
jgi:hypothetical protein